jgi:hypothetical protein
MTELEVLARNIHGLKELLRVAWRDLANPLLTPFDRREARNHVNQYSAELRRYLQLIEAERTPRPKTISGAKRGPPFRAPVALGCLPRGEPRETFARVTATTVRRKK